MWQQQQTLTQHLLAINSYQVYASQPPLQETQCQQYVGTIESRMLPLNM